MSYIRDIIKKIIKEVNKDEQYWNKKEQNEYLLKGRAKP